MKRLRIVVLAATSAAVSLAPLSAQTSVSSVPAIGSPVNPLKVALLHWYTANHTTRFSVGGQPYGLCFDGANIWSANYGSASVSKVRASDGTSLGTFSLPGTGPIGVAFDGANIWVAGDTYVQVLQPASGTILSQFRPATSTTDIAFDGANVWVSILDDNGLSKY